MPKEHKRRRRQRHQPLGDQVGRWGVLVHPQIDADNRTYKEVKRREEKEIKEDEYIPADISRKILNLAHEQQVGLGVLSCDEQMEMSDGAEEEDVNTEKDFHFQVSNMNDEDDMADLSSDEGETEEFIRDYKISAEDDVG